MNEELERLKRELRRELGRELAQIGRDLVRGLGPLEGAARLEGWLSRASALGGPWQEGLGAEARVLGDRIRSGHPAQDGMERLMRLLMEASDRLDGRPSVPAAG